MMPKKQNDKNNKGLLTIDFIFSFLVVWGLFMAFLLMSFTLMMSSVAQYVVFATNRSHISGHISTDKQDEMGTRKFEDLIDALRPMVSTGTQSWFRFELEDPDPGPPQQLGSQNQRKYGFKINYTATVARETSFPIVGGPGDGSVGANFGRATVKAYMYREPTTSECLEFNEARWEKILDRFQNLPSYINGSDTFGSSADNGC